MSPTAPPSPSAASLTGDPQSVRAMLKDGRERLRERFRSGLPALELLARHARLVDDAASRIWESTGICDRGALLAVGGYGRGELYPHSDVDILVLLPESAGPELEAATETLLGRFWDSGLDIGHSVRTVGDCATRAADDVTIQTNQLESRLLAGSRHLYEEFLVATAAVLDPQRFFRSKQLEQQQRHERHTDTNLEPNLKESPGGLRDLHNILWIAGAASLGRSWKSMVEAGLLLPEEARQISRDHNLLADLRIRLHYLAGRREDRLVFDYQTLLSRELGMVDRPNRRSSEQLMQRFYRTAAEVRQLNTIVLQNLGSRIFPARSDTPAPINDRFQARNELLDARSDDLFEREPGAILESFLLLQEHRELKGYTAGTLRALWRARHRINPAYRRDPRNRRMFLQILGSSSRVVREIRRMHQHGILGRYLPAFGRVSGQMQHDLYHVYTVDEHILKVVRNLRRFAVAELAHEFPLASRLMNDFARPEVLYLAGLFHDIAKGRGGDHSTLGAVDARRFCRDHGLPEDDVALVAWLVENHLVMSSTAQKQDVSDPDVVVAFAARTKDDRHLVALYLLTVADIRGTSPKVWNAWKAKLLEDLFWATRRCLAGENTSTESSVEVRQREALAELRLHAVPENAHKRLWAELDTTYFLRHDPKEIAWHTRVLNYRVNSDVPVVRSRVAVVGEGLQVMIYTRDQEGLFARICGFFGADGYNIVEAKVHTTRHGYALDSFLVLDPQNRATRYRDLTSYVEHGLSEQISAASPLTQGPRGRISRQLRHFPLTPEISITPDEKGAYKVLTIVAGDRPGLLYGIALVLNRYGVSLHTAKINTLGERAEDTFLIAGNALSDPKTVVRLEADLLQTLQP